MSYLKSSILVSIFLVAVGLVFILAWLNISNSLSYTDLTSTLTATTLTFGTLLGIITAGLMFTQGTFGELASDLAEKLPDYLVEALSLERIQSMEASLLATRKTFTQLAASTTIIEERDVYERIVKEASSMFVSFAVLLNLKLKQQGLPDTDLLVSEMDSDLYRVYRRRRQSIMNVWEILYISDEVIDMWEGPTAFFVEKSSEQLALEADIRRSISILKLRENVDKTLVSTSEDEAKTLGDLNSKMNELSKQFRADRVPQLLSQMKQASTLRGRYFYLALVFIAAPLLINLLILPQFSQTTAVFFKPFISLTSFLSVMGVVFLLLYVYEILKA
jgi:hypothetical protein